MKFKTYFIVLIALIMPLLFGNKIYGQEVATPSAQAAESDVNIGKISNSINEVDGRAEEILKSLKSTANILDEEQFYKEINTDFDENKRTYKRLKAGNSKDVDAAMSLHAGIKQNYDKVSGIIQTLINKTNKVEEAKDKLSDLNKDLDRYKANAFDSNTLKDKMQKSVSMIKRFINDAENNKRDINRFQDRCISLQNEINREEKEVAEYVAEQKNKLFDKTDVEMYSFSYLKDVLNVPALFSKFVYGLREVKFSVGDFLKRNFGVLVFQLVLIWLMTLGIRYAGQMELEVELTKKLLDYYFSASVFFTFVVTISFLNNLSPAIELIYNVVFMLVVLRLIPVIFGNEKFHKEVKFVVLLMTLIYFFDFITLPQPIYRLFVALVGLFGMLMAYKSNLQEEFASEDSSFCAFFLNVLKKVLVCVLGIVFLSQFLGYGNLSSHLLLITFKTLFTLVTVWMFLQISDDILYILLHNGKAQSFGFIKNHSSKLLWHFVTIIDSLIVIFTFGAILAFWGVYDTSIDAVNGITGFGFDVRGVNISVGRLIWTFFAVYLTFAFSWVIRTLLEEDILPGYGVEKGVIASVNRLVYYVFIILAFLFGLSALGIDVQNLTYVIGALGVGIGFGLQNIVNNFASGIILLFERSIKVGDTVVVGGTWGTVKKLGLRATVVQTFENAEMIVPNSDLVSSTVNNWSMSEKSARFSANVGVAYGSDTEKVSQILKDVALVNPNVLKTPAPSVVFNEFGDSSLNFELRAWVSDIGIRASTKNEIMFAIDKAFKENGIEIPFPQRDVHIKSEK